MKSPLFMSMEVKSGVSDSDKLSPKSRHNEERLWLDNRLDNTKEKSVTIILNTTVFSYIVLIINISSYTRTYKIFNWKLQCIILLNVLSLHKQYNNNSYANGILALNYYIIFVYTKYLSVKYQVIFVFINLLQALNIKSY